MNIDLTQIIIALIGLCSTVITVVIVPFIKSKFTDVQWAKIRDLITTGVAAAEQLSLTGVINKSERKEYVVNKVKSSGLIEKLTRLGVTVDIDQIYDMIEAEVYTLPNKMTNTQYRKMAEQTVEAMAAYTIESEVTNKVEAAVNAKLEDIK